MNHCSCGNGNGVCDACIEGMEKSKKSPRGDSCGCIQRKSIVEQDARDLLKSTNRVFNTR